MAETNPVTIVSSVDELKKFLAKIEVQLKACRRPPAANPGAFRLFMDLEGQNLSREGTLSLITVLISTSNVTYLVDIHQLGKLAFATAAAPSPDDGPEGASEAKGKDNDSGNTSTLTLKSILEDATVPKYFWDVRNDADALWSHYQVRVAGVTDIQLFENASGNLDKTYLKGLDRCIEKDLKPHHCARVRFAAVKKEVKAMMDAGRGTSTDIFARRPLERISIEYCVGDVAFLPFLFDVYNERASPAWKDRAMHESARRVEEACSPGYEPNGPNKRVRPWPWEGALEAWLRPHFPDEVEQ